MMPYRNAPRGGPSAGLPPTAFVSFIQNHDQIGNRAFGERLNSLAPPEAIRAVASVYLLAPQIPMLFMGEEWGATQPFLFFCDFGGELAEAVRNGRREEFSRFPEFADPERVAKIPDPSAEATFLASKLDWSRVDAGRLAYYRELLKTRRDIIRPLLPSIRHGGEALVVGEQRCESAGGPANAGSSSTPISRLVASSFLRLNSLPFGFAATPAPCSDLGPCAGDLIPHERSARDLSSATARGLRFQPSGGDRASPGAAWRESRLPLSDLQSAPRQRAWL